MTSGLACFLQLDLQYVLAALAGFLSHALYFIRGHRDTEALSIITMHLLLGIGVAMVQTCQFGVSGGFTRTCIITSLYYTALFTSIIIYRVFFHRLHRFPGPHAAKVTNLYGPYLNRNGKMHDEYIKLFRKYGDIVRVGPNELMMLSIDALSQCHGAQSTCRKSTVFEIIHYKGAHSLHSLIDKDTHRSRRQVWEATMTDKALAAYEKNARQTVYDWLKKLEGMQGQRQAVDVSLFSALIALDMAGRVGYSRDLNAIQGGKENRILQLLELNTGIVGKLGLLAWPLALGSQLDIVPEKKEYESLAAALVDDREKASPQDKEDIMKYLLEDYHSETPTSYIDRNALYIDSQVILSAGTFNVRPVLAFSFHFMAKTPGFQDQLRECLTPVFGKTQPGEFCSADLATVEFLDAIINETMRMYNPTATNAPRITPPEGIMVGDMYIPGEVTVHTPIWAFHRSEKYFDKAQEFIPERWTTRRDLISDKRAFHPFLVGPRNCVGRRHSLMFIRTVIAYTVWYYDLSFAPGEDGARIEKECEHAFFLKPGRLELSFAKRT